nr:U1 small nuclear ribonucleoprotein 70 kDa isoform X2 [Tanacetum cinerariifolium]
MEELVEGRGDHLSKLQEKSQVLIHAHSLQHLTILSRMLLVRGGKIGRLGNGSKLEILKLEDALASAKKLTSNRKKQLTKLHKCFLNMKEYGEKLRSSEDELQSLVGSTMNELDYHNGLDTDGLLANGNA